MKKYILITVLFVVFNQNNLFSQNLIVNPGFEKHWGGDCSPGTPLIIYDSFVMVSGLYCSLKDWIRISESPDGYYYLGGYPFPTNENAYYIYPHSDSVCVGLGFVYKAIPNIREIIEGKLIKPLANGHHYQFSMYVQLFDSISWSDVGKIVGSNSFSAIFTDTMIPSHTDLPIQNYTPQVQINQMVTDTQHWVLLMDTFIANGGEKFISIGNFKTDAQTQTQLVQTVNNSLPEVAYYFIDDVSLIDLDDVGIEEMENRKLSVYPNPTKDKLTVNSYQFAVNTIEVTDVLGRVMLRNEASNQQINNSSTQQISVNVAELPQGIYFIKATEIKGNVRVGKFVKE